MGKVWTEVILGAHVSAADGTHLRRSTATLSLIAGSIVLLFSGCTTLPSGRAWGESATIRPGWTSIRVAARDAALDPWVWVPVVGAAAFQVNGFDRKVSNWAREHTPVFGSQDGAEDWSDDLRSAAGLTALATLLATPSGAEPDEWVVNKAKGGAVEWLAVGATSLVTGALKKVTDRERPNGTDFESFPSGHTSSAAVLGRLAEFNLGSVAMNSSAMRTANIAIDAIVIGTGWARVEAGEHFPSDALVGMALGNFMASFFTRAFLDAGTLNSIALDVIDGEAVLRWSVRF
jgi:membrane-associated phospholipid phosphatase